MPRAPIRLELFNALALAVSLEMERPAAILTSVSKVETIVTKMQSV